MPLDDEFKVAVSLGAATVDLQAEFTEQQQNGKQRVGMKAPLMWIYSRSLLAADSITVTILKELLRLYCYHY